MKIVIRVIKNGREKIIRCFIASPGDIAEERDICEKVFSEINAGIGTAYGFVLQSLRWENDVHPGLWNGGQDVGKSTAC